MRKWAWPFGLLACVCFVSLGHAQDARGDWLGAITTPSGALHLALHVRPGPGNTLTGTLDSPDQGSGDFPLEAVTLTGATLSFTLPILKGNYVGQWDPTTGRWIGTWTQGGHPIPLAFARGTPVRPPSLCPNIKSDRWPNRCDLMFWTPAEQSLGYRNMDKSYPVRMIRRGASASPLPKADRPIDVRFDYAGRSWTADDFVKQTRAAGLLVIKDGKIVLERYGLGETPGDRWTTMSVTKSITGTLVGAAIKDGAIAGLDAQVTDYLPELKGSAYDGVTVRQLITMTSGVKWNENYGDPKADIDHFDRGEGMAADVDPVLTYMARLPRAAPPGTKFLYSTGDATLAGIMVAHATHQHLADYLSQKIWAPVGMDEDGEWILDMRGKDEVAGGCISLTLRDEGRFGLFMLSGGRAGAKPVLPDGWTADATINHAPNQSPGSGYGYFWWVRPGGYSAIGIFGQSLYIDPAQHLIVVVQSAWPFATDVEDGLMHTAFLAAVHKATDDPARAN